MAALRTDADHNVTDHYDSLSCTAHRITVIELCNNARGNMTATIPGNLWCKTKERQTTTRPPRISCMGSLIELVDTDKHLGVTIGRVTQEDMVKAAIMDLNKGSGMLQSHFKWLPPDVMYSLYKSHCMSVYGSVLCDFQHPSVERFSTAWRKAIFVHALTCILVLTLPCYHQSVTTVIGRPNSCFDGQSLRRQSDPHLPANCSTVPALHFCCQPPLPPTPFSKTGPMSRREPWSETCCTFA
ncbi:hypothetical protein CAPTEDRAFT_204992 [Capitella teleta]|uniref:Uncharacterized protein n=1 Tax=Capitella teleta TaxID=283909 RepID=R7UJU0_CAPTE|nr:hypothetical protein CAPTEDRAFT_204992 [Capitella teleta]|eukprot:ELU06373.1 hypothetical protein CAPTEDRAFT_204992 [Capitella teleta]